MSDFIGFLLCISPVVIIVGLVIYGIVFSKSHAVHDKRFIEKVTVTLNSLNDDPQNEQLADSLIQICKDLKQVYAPRILLGGAFRQCDH